MAIFYTSKRDLPSRVRVFIDFVVERMTDLVGGGATRPRTRGPRSPDRSRRRR